MLKELLIIIVLISLFECIAQGCLKKFFKDNKKYYFVISVICYAIVCYLLVCSYQFKSMGIVNCIWSGMSILFIVWIGYFFFNENIDIQDLMGIGLIIIGIWFILYDGPHGKEFLAFI
jgi:multidrug transporter EmrE-like cation transporter